MVRAARFSLYLYHSATRLYNRGLGYGIYRLKSCFFFFESIDHDPVRRKKVIRSKPSARGRRFFALAVAKLDEAFYSPPCVRPL